MASVMIPPLNQPLIFIGQCSSQIGNVFPEHFIVISVVQRKMCVHTAGFFASFFLLRGHNEFVRDSGKYRQNKKRVERGWEHVYFIYCSTHTTCGGQRRAKRLKIQREDKGITC